MCFPFPQQGGWVTGIVFTTFFTFMTGICSGYLIFVWRKFRVRSPAASLLVVATPRCLLPPFLALPVHADPLPSNRTKRNRCPARPRQISRVFPAGKASTSLRSLETARGMRRRGGNRPSRRRLTEWKIRSSTKRSSGQPVPCRSSSFSRRAAARRCSPCSAPVVCRCLCGSS